MILKYRAWINDGEHSRMVRSDQAVMTAIKHCYGGHGVVEGTTGYHYVDTATRPDKYILMQSTGLKDKNGVEIFEGDVLLHTSSSVNYSDTYWHSYVQVYRMDSGAYRIKGKHIYDTELMSARNRLEVVGNIYQNQDLLDKEYFSTSDGIVEQANEN